MAGTETPKITPGSGQTTVRPDDERPVATLPKRDAVVATPTFNGEQARAFLLRERAATPVGVELPRPVPADPQAQAQRALRLLQENNSRDLLGMFRGMPKDQQQAIVAAFEAMPNIRRMPFLGERRTFETIAARRLSTTDGLYLSAILRNPSSVPSNADRAEAALRTRDPQQVLALYRELTPQQITDMEREYPGRYSGNLHERIAGSPAGAGMLSGDDLAAYTQLRTGQQTTTAAVPPAELQRQRVETLTRLLGPQAYLDMPAIEETMRGIPQADRPALSEAFRAANEGRTIDASLEALMRRNVEQFGMPLNGGAMPPWAQTRYEHMRDSWNGTRAPEAVMLDAATATLPDTMAASAIARMTPAELAEIRPRFEALYRERFPGADVNGVFDRVLGTFGAQPRRTIEMAASIGDVYRTGNFAAAEERVRAIWDDERSLTPGGWQEFRNRFANHFGINGSEVDETAHRFFEGASDLRRRVEAGHTPNEGDVREMMQRYRAFGQRLEAFYKERGENAENAAMMASLVAGVGFGAVLGTAGLTTRGIVASAMVGATTQTAVQAGLDPEVTTQQLALAFATTAALETGGGLALRSGLRAWEARRGVNATVPGAADDIAHATQPDGRFSAFLPERDALNPNPRYVGRATFDGSEVEVRAFDGGRIQIGDRTFQGRLDGDARQLFFRGEDGQQYAARLAGPNNEFSITPFTNTADRAVIDDQLVTLQGRTVTDTQGRVVGFADTLADGRIATRLDATDPFNAQVAEAMARRNAQLTPLSPGSSTMVTSPSNGVRYAIDNGRALRLETIAGRDIVTSADGQSRIVTIVDGRLRPQQPLPGIQPLGNDAVLFDGQLQRLQRLEGHDMLIGRGVNDTSLRVYQRGPDGSLLPANVTDGTRTMFTPNGDQFFLQPSSTSPFASVHSVVDAEGLPDLMSRVVRGEDGTIRFARRTGEGMYAIEDTVRLTNQNVVMDGALYRREFAGSLDDGNAVLAVRRLEGDGPGWRVVTADGAPTSVPVPDDVPMVLRHRNTAQPEAIIDRGIVYRANHSPDDAGALSRRVLGYLGGDASNYPVENRAVLASIQRAFRGDDAALDAALRGTNRAAVARLEAAVGPNARDQLSRAFGIVSEQRDPFTYATRVGSMTDDTPMPTRLPNDAAVGLADYPDDIGIYVRQNGALRRATDDEVRAQFNRTVPELATPVRNSDFDELVRPARVVTRGRDANTSIVIERAGESQRQTVRVTLPPGGLTGNAPTPAELAELLERIPSSALRSLSHISYDSPRLASFTHDPQLLRLSPNNWPRDPGERLRILVHELAGHGIEMGDPVVHRQLLLARRLDGIGATRPYGNMNILESFAVGVEDLATSPLDVARQAPHFSRVAWPLLRDAQNASPARRRELLGGLSLMLLFGIGIDSRMPTSDRPI